MALWVDVVVTGTSMVSQWRRKVGGDSVVASCKVDGWGKEEILVLGVLLSGFVVIGRSEASAKRDAVEGERSVMSWSGLSEVAEGCWVELAVICLEGRVAKKESIFEEGDDLVREVDDLRVTRVKPELSIVG